MTRSLGFLRRNNVVNQQVRVAVDQPRQQRRVAEINDFCAGGVSLHLLRRPDLL